MNKTQANTVADSLLEPRLQAHEKHRLRAQAKEQAEAKKRRYRWPHLVGLVLGALLTYFAGQIFGFADVTSSHGIWTVVAGGIVGAVLARVVVAVRHHRAGANKNGR